MSVLLSSIEDGQKLEHDTAIAYLGYAREAYLLFDITNATAKFVEREDEANPVRVLKPLGGGGTRRLRPASRRARARGKSP